MIAALLLAATLRMEDRQSCLSFRPDRQDCLSSTTTASGLRHIVILRPAHDPSELHIYIEGDGTPWVHGRTVAADPTPRNRIALRLMHRDPASSAYVGRPCYFGLAQSEGCTPELWTTRRYAPEVIESMRTVIRQLLADTKATRLVLIGHSGGGTIAMALAPSFPETIGVITIGANLDVEAWTKLHGYLPVAAPPLQPLAKSIRQIHLLGGRDRNVPPELATPAIERLGGEPLVYRRFDHSCCWEREWPKILGLLNTACCR